MPIDWRSESLKIYWLDEKPCTPRLSALPWNILRRLCYPPERETFFGRRRGTVSSFLLSFSSPNEGNKTKTAVRKWTGACPSAVKSKYKTGTEMSRQFILTLFVKLMERGPSSSRRYCSSGKMLCVLPGIAY
jgi:hypothetical protein